MKKLLSLVIVLGVLCWIGAPGTSAAKARTHPSPIFTKASCRSDAGDVCICGSGQTCTATATSCSCGSGGIKRPPEV